MNEKNTVTIIGGGNGAFAAAAHLTYQGFKVILCDPYNNGESTKPLLETKKLHYSGCLGSGTVELYSVTNDVKKAVSGSGFIIVCVPSTAHESIAKAIAPALKPNSIIMLNPGHTGGTLHFTHVLRTSGFTDQFLIGETNTLTYVTRKSSPDTINISNITKNIYLAAQPASAFDAFCEQSCQYYPDFIKSESIIGTSMRNVNAIMHIPVMVLTAAWIERTKGDFYFYRDTATPSVARLMDIIDKERMAISKAWKEETEPLMDLLFLLGTIDENIYKSGSLQSAFKDSEANRYIKAPTDLDHRFMHEDVGFGLVPMASLGEIAGVKTPGINTLIELAGMINNIDYRDTGRNLKAMGLEGKSLKAIEQYILNG